MLGLELTGALFIILIAILLIVDADGFVMGFSSVALLCIVAVLFFFDGLARQSQRGCGGLAHQHYGLYSGVPYETVGDSVKDGDKIFVFVRIVDGTGTASVRCVETKTELPKRFIVGSEGAVLSLLSLNAVPSAAK